MKRETTIHKLLLFFSLFTFSISALSSQTSHIKIDRSACATKTNPCLSRYHFSDFAEYAKVNKKHDNGMPHVAYVNANVQIGPSNLSNRDGLHFNNEGELVEIWSRYQRMIGEVTVRHKTAYPVHPNGGISSIQIYKTQFVRGVFYPFQTNLTLDSKGYVLTDDFYNIDDLSELEVTQFEQAEHYITEPFNLLGLEVPVSSSITVNTKGQLQSVKLGVSQWSDGIFYPGKAELKIDSQGRIDIEELYERLNNKETIPTHTQTQAQILDHAVKIGSLVLPKGTLVEINLGNYTAAHLLHETDVCGIAKQGETIGLQAYTNDTYSFFIRNKDSVKIQELTLGSNDTGMRYYDNCNLWKATLSTSATIKGFPLAANNEIELAKNGDVMSGTLDKHYQYNHVTLSAGTKFTFNPRYSVGLLLYSGGDVTDGDRVYESKFMQIYKNGVIAWGILQRPALIAGTQYDAGTQLSFTPDGELVSAKLPH